MLLPFPHSCPSIPVPDNLETPVLNCLRQMLRAFPPLLLGSLLILCAVEPPRLQSQEATTKLTTVREILARPREALSLGQADGTTIRLKGIVTDADAKNGHFSLHDGTGALSVTLPVGDTPAELASEVEVEGHMIGQVLVDRPWSQLQATNWKTVGKGSLPVPTAATVPEVADFQHLDQWVAVEGVVLQVKYSSPLLTVQISNDKRWCNALVRDWPKEGMPKDWVGATVRIVGVNNGFARAPLFTLTVPSPAQITVLKPGVENPFDAPATNTTVLQKKGKPSSERYKLTGTLLETVTGGVSYVRGADGGTFSFYPVYPLDQDKSGRNSTPVSIPPCKPGDVVEVVGSPCYISPSVHLSYAMYRVMRTGPLPEPVPTDVASVLSGKSDSDLVDLHGRLVSLEDVAVSPTRWRTTLRIEDGGRTILADLDSPKRGALADLHPDHLVKVRAIVVGRPQYSETRLWLPSPRDVQSLGVVSAVIARRFWSGVGFAAACAIPLLIWAVMLSRSRNTVRKLNAGLEERVSERTAELAAAKDELSKALAQERDVNELKTRFISLVSHEFRTPLGITMSAVELLRHHRARLSEEKLEELLEDIHSSTLRMSGLMEQVLILGRVEAGKSAYHPTPVDLEELCGKITDEGLSATNRRCPVNFTSSGDFTNAHADEGLIRHIFSNLISNAVKYSPQDSPVEFHLQREGDSAVFTVRDKGIGIPQADQLRLYEAFHRASNVGDVPGTGLGLLLVKRCVDLHQGIIRVESAAGEGTTFTVTVPIKGED